MFSNQTFALYGKIGFIIFDPSNGGSGIKLKTPSPIFIVTVDNTSCSIIYNISLELFAPPVTLKSAKYIIVKTIPLLVW